MIINIPFLLPPVDPPADSGGTDASLPCDGSGRLPPHPHHHKLAAFGKCGRLGRISLHHLHNKYPSVTAPWDSAGVA